MAQMKNVLDNNWCMNDKKYADRSLYLFSLRHSLIEVRF